MVRNFLKITMLLLVGPLVHSQVSQDCVRAIPICGNTPINGGTLGPGADDFDGQRSSGCLERSASGAIESNSAWYRFKVAAPGQLGFNIGHDPGEDWDFALYRSGDCGQLGEPLRCNFFDNREGAGFIGVGVDPSGDGDSLLYEPWLEVLPGEEYFLMINNYSNQNSGFSIQFTGTLWETNPLDALDCSIIDNLLGPPVAACGTGPVTLDATTVGALEYQWYRESGQGFVLIPGERSATLEVADSGLYRVLVDTGVDGLLSEVQVGFSPIPWTGAMTDVKFCQGEGMAYDLSAKDAQALGSRDPVDIVVSYHRSPGDAQSGARPLPKQYLPHPGPQTLYVRTSSRANPNCSDASASFLLDVLEAPALDFSEEVALCGALGRVEIGEVRPDPLYEYSWSTGERTPTLVVTRAGEYTLTVTNSSGGPSCTASRIVRVYPSDAPKIAKIDIEDLRATGRVTIHAQSGGPYEFSLDDGPFQRNNVFEDVAPGVHSVGLRDLYGCGELREEIVVVGFPSIFTPNGDVLNQRWQLEGLSTLKVPVVTLYDRYGKLIKTMDQNDPGWDGTHNGRPMPSTDYWFKLSYMDRDGNRSYAKYLRAHFSLRR